MVSQYPAKLQEISKLFSAGGLKTPCSIALQGTKELTDLARKLFNVSSKTDITAVNSDKKLISKKQIASAISPAPYAKRSRRSSWRMMWIKVCG